MKKLLQVVLSLFLVASLVACNDSGTKEEYVFDKQGTFNKEETFNDVRIAADGVILENKIINGDLIVESPGIEGDLTLNNVSVAGSINVNQPSAEYTIRMYDVTANTMSVNNESVPLRLYASKGTEITSLTSKGSVTVTEQALTKQGFMDVSVNGDSVVLTLISSGLEVLTINGSGTSTVALDSGSMVRNAVVNSPTSLLGAGIIELLTANANVSYETKPSTVVLKDGVLVNGENPNVTTPSITTTPAVTKKPAVTTTKKPVVTTKPDITTKPQTTTSIVTTTTTIANTKPVLTGTNLTITVGNAFDPLTGITIYDKEDGGYITVTSSHITSNTVDRNKAGTYQVVYTYTDKGGLTSTYTRVITVQNDPNKLAMPTGLTLTVISDGGLRLNWTKESNVSGYLVYVNGRTVGDVTKLNYAYLEEYISRRSANTIGVRAVSDSAKIADSDLATTTYTWTAGTISTASKWDVGKTNKVTYQFNPLGIPSNGTNVKVVYTLDAYNTITRRYSPVPGATLDAGLALKTNSNGEATYTKYPVAGDYIEPKISEPGQYVLSITILVNNIELETLETEFSVVDANGSTTPTDPVLSRDKYVPIITDFYDDGWAYANGGVYLGFTMPADLDMRPDTTRVSVFFEYSINGGTYTTLKNDSNNIFIVDESKFPDVLKQGGNYYVRINAGTTGLSAFTTELKNAYDTNKSVRIGATVQVDTAGQTYTADSRAITLSYKYE